MGIEYEIGSFRYEYVWRNLEGNYHRDYDRPAIVYDDYSGVKGSWYYDNLIEQYLMGTTVDNHKGELYWVQNGKLHRFNDKPAVMLISYVTMKWYQHGTLYRSNDKPSIIDFDRKIWCTNGVIHRENDKPAIKYSNNTKEYWQNGKMWRKDGLPTVTHLFGEVKEEWKECNQEQITIFGGFDDRL